MPETSSQTPLRRPVRPIPHQEPEKKERIKVWMAAAMLIVALCVDGAQALLTLLGIGLVLGPIISAIAYFVYWIWFMLLGVSFTKSPKKLGVMGLSAIIEATLSFLPGFTLAIISVIILTKSEDKGGLLSKAVSVAQGKIKT